MGLFDRFKSGGKKEEQPKKSGSHGSHWDTVVDSDEKIHQCVSAALKNPERKDQNPSDHMELTGWFRGDEIQTCVISGTVNRAPQVLSAFPFISDGTVHEITVTGMEEWANGFEAQVIGFFKDARIAFFDSLYFRNKNNYPTGKPIHFALGASAYAIRPTVLEPVTLDDGTVHHYDPSFCGYAPFGRGDIDDFEFNAVIKEVGEASFEGNTIYQLTIPLCKQDYHGEQKDIDIPLFVSERVLNGYVPKAGERVTGVLWLQGHQV